MFHHVSVSNLHWSAQKRMQRLFRRGERRNSITIVVYSGSIMRSMCIILYNQPHYESMTRARSNITACQLRRRQRSTLGRLRRHIFMTTVGLAVGYFRHTRTHRDTCTCLECLSKLYCISGEAALTCWPHSHSALTCCWSHIKGTSFSVLIANHIGLCGGCITSLHVCICGWCSCVKNVIKIQEVGKSCIYMCFF